MEYIAASDAAKEAVWLWKFIRELGVAPSIDGPVLLYCDNTGAIDQAKEPGHISALSTSCAGFILFEKSLNEVTLIFRRLMERRTLPTHSLKHSALRSLMITN